MRVPTLERYTRFFQGVGVFIAGGIVGASIYMTLHQHLYNYLWEENYAYRDKIKAMEEEMKGLQKLKNESRIIAKIIVRVDRQEGREPLDSVTQKELEAKLRSDLKFLIGKKSADVQENPDVYKQLLSRKTYFGIQGKDYRVDVQALYMNGSQLTFWVIAYENTKAPATLSEPPSDSGPIESGPAGERPSD